MTTSAINVSATCDVPDVAAQLAQAESLRRAGNIAHAIAVAQAASADAKHLLDEALVARCELELGNLHRYVPNALEAIRLLNLAERYFRAHPQPQSRPNPLLASVLTRQGMTLGDMGDHTRALDLYREALGIIEANSGASDPREEATCLGAIGVACTQLDEFEQAEDAYRRAIPLFAQAGSLESIVFVYNNLAILRVRTLEKLASGDEAKLLTAQQAFQFIDEGLARNVEVNSPMARAALFNTRGDLLAAMGRLDESMYEISQSLMVYRAMPLPRGEADALTNLGETLLKLGRLDEALAQLREAEQIIKTHSLKDHERKLHQLFADAFERHGDNASALVHLKRFHQLEVESQRRDTQKKLQQLAMRTEIEKAMAEARSQREHAAKLAAQNETLDRIAHEDALTGVANRRRLDEWANDHPAALPNDMAVALLDIDHFKRINDTYSHAVGDAVLRELGVVLRAQSRNGDLIARYGGEEFVVVLHGLTGDDASDLMERLRLSVAAHEWSKIDPTLRVTTSIGVAQADGETFQYLIEAADAALYKAKQAGRNQVVLSPQR